MEANQHLYNRSLWTHLKLTWRSIVAHVINDLQVCKISVNNSPAYCLYKRSLGDETTNTNERREVNIIIYTLDAWLCFEMYPKTLIFCSFKLFIDSLSQECFLRGNYLPKWGSRCVRLFLYTTPCDKGAFINTFILWIDICFWFVWLSYYFGYYDTMVIYGKIEILIKMFQIFLLIIYMIFLP